MMNKCERCGRKIFMVSRYPQFCDPCEAELKMFVLSLEQREVGVRELRDGDKPDQNRPL